MQKSAELSNEPFFSQSDRVTIFLFEAGIEFWSKKKKHSSIFDLCHLILIAISIARKKNISLIADVPQNLISVEAWGLVKCVRECERGSVCVCV